MKKNIKAILTAAILTIAVVAPVSASKAQASTESNVFGGAMNSIAVNTIEQAQELADGAYADAEEVVISTADVFGHGLGAASFLFS